MDAITRLAVVLKVGCRGGAGVGMETERER